MGATSPPLLDLDEVSEDLRVALWNCLQPMIFDSSQSQYGWVPRAQLAYDFLHWRRSSLVYNPSFETERLERWFFDASWYEVYNVIEYFAPLLDHDRLNAVFELEGSPYRFLAKVLSPITDPRELEAIAEAQQQGDRFAGARTHITEALRMLGQRPQPDYRNAIKEAISAVESTLKLLTAENHADLAGALREFRRTHHVHGALFNGLDALYGYTSNEHGLRHALLEAGANVGFAEAKFMIVACAAFMNFLILKSVEL